MRKHAPPLRDYTSYVVLTVFIFLISLLSYFGLWLYDDVRAANTELLAPLIR